MNQQPKIFLSYCHKNVDVADAIDKGFQSIGIMFQRDVRDVGYMQSIRKFMEKIRDNNYALMIISDDFLKSENCMYEVIELLKEKDIQEKILLIVLLLIVLEDANIYKFEGKKHYIKYWNDRFNSVSKELEELSREISASLCEELKKVKNISLNIDEFLCIASDKKSVPLSVRKKNNYKEILEIIGFDKEELVKEIFKILDIKDEEEQDLALEDFLIAYPKNPYGHFYRAHLAKERKNFKKARKYYENYLTKINKTDYIAYNNLGNIYAVNFKEFGKALEVYNKSICIKPDYDEAYNNLGTYFQEGFSDYIKAKEYYEKSIEVNPQNDKAYFNLATLSLLELKDCNFAK